MDDLAKHILENLPDEQCVVEIGNHTIDARGKETFSKKPVKLDVMPLNRKGDPRAAPSS